MELHLATHIRVKWGVEAVKGRNIILSSTDLKTVLRVMMAESGTNSFATIARTLGIKESTFRSAIYTGSLRVEDFVRVAQSMGYKVMVAPEEND